MMKPFVNTTLILSSLVFSALLQAQPPAQENTDKKNWYQIELLVLTYENAESSQQESWDPQPELKYPERIVDLQGRTRIEVMLNDPTTLGTINPTFDDKTSSPLNNETRTDTGSDEPTVFEEITPQPITVTMEQQPFTLLEKNELTFRAFTRRLARQSDIRILFHEAWRQPIAKRSEAHSILILGGNPFDNHYELEGSISLGLERYLHIKTNLWLSTFVSNLGREQSPWPLLPPHPVTSTLKGTTQSNDPFNMPRSTEKFSSFDSLFANPFEEIADNRYAVDRTVLLKQERRMRSSELHYIDHPLMGLLIRITPYTFPEPEPAIGDQNETEPLALDSQ